jgi:hypothetical protein
MEMDTATREDIAEEMRECAEALALAANRLIGGGKVRYSIPDILADVAEVPETARRLVSAMEFCETYPEPPMPVRMVTGLDGVTRRVTEEQYRAVAAVVALEGVDGDEDANTVTYWYTVKTDEDGRPFKVTTAMGTRTWTADDADHAREQHEDAFPDEAIENIDPPDAAEQAEAAMDRGQHPYQ